MIHYIFDLDDTILVHRNDIHYDYVSENHELTHYLDKCQGDRYIYTNANLTHAESILKSMNIRQKFKHIYTRDDFTWMKPSFTAGYAIHRDIIKDRVESGNPVSEIRNDRFVYFDDIPINHDPAKRLGWTTVWIHPQHEHVSKYSHIDYAFPNLVDALRNLEKIIS